MSEIKRLLLLIFLLLLIPLLAYILGYNFPFIEGLTADYQARLILENFPVLKEKYVYHVKSEGYTMLYKTWKVPLYFNETPSKTGVVVKEISVIAPSKAGLIPYVKDHKGDVYVLSHTNEDVRELIAKKAERNEVGVLNPQGIHPGDYTISYVFKLYLPIETIRGEYYHLNLKLADEHIPYPSVKITIEDFNGYLIDLYPHLSSFATYKEGKAWVVEGKAPRDSLVEIEMVLSPNSIKGAVISIQRDDLNVKELTAKLNSGYYITYNVFNVIKYLAVGFSLSFPLITYIIYQKYGRERKYAVPEFLSFIPNKNRKPWVVNLIFKGRVNDFDVDGFYATLLDLHMRGYIEIEAYDGEIRISVLKEDELLDEYERKVLAFLNDFSFNGVFDSSKLKEHVTSIRDNRGLIKRVKERFDEVLKYRNPRLVKEFIELTGKKVINGLAFTLIAFSAIILIMYFLSAQDYSSSFASFNAYMSSVMSAAIFLQSLVCLVSPPSLFGRWKGEAYNEKLQWDAFRRFLSNIVLIKKYAPEDLVIWKEWLVYATTLGVGESVIKAMKALNIEIPEVRVSERLPAIYIIYQSQILPATSSETSPSGSTGGFGVGGGHGGGGAGGR